MIRLILFCLLFPVPALACGLETACPLGERSYHVRAPDGWDGATPLAVLMHFHGWMRQGDLVVNHARIAGATRKRDVLLVAPNGRGKTWRFWSAPNEDVQFAQAVLDDVKARYRVDDSRIFVSGYSYGSAMAWRFVCEAGAPVAALLAVAGSLSQNETCPESPQQVRHVHGLADTVMDFPMGPGGDRLYPVQLWRDAYDCAEPSHPGPWRQVSWLELDRYAWDCPGGQVTLDLHPGGHFIPHGWIARQLDELLGLPFTYP